MFDKKVKNDTDLLGKTNRIVEGTKINGNIIAIADTRIDGELIGDFETKGKLVIGPAGRVKGNIICKNCDIEGKHEGKVIIEELLNLKATAVVIGEINCGRLSIEPGAVVNGSCQMTGNKNQKNEPIAQKAQ